MRVGVVGIGFGQAVHVPAFRRDPRAVVVALAASTYERAARIAERLGVPKAYGDWRVLVADPEVDLVSIAVPPALQPAVGMAAAAASKAVLCEKPVALDAASAELVLRATRAAGVPHAVDLEFGDLPAWAEVKRLCEQRAFGAPRSAEFVWSVRTRPHGPASWKAAAPMGGALGGFASHALYLIELSLGSINVLSARLDPTGGARRVNAWLGSEDGCRVAVCIVTDAPQPAGLRFEVRCDGGTIVLENPDPRAIDGYRLRAGRIGADLQPLVCAGVEAIDGDPRIAPVARLAARFIDAVRGGAPMRPDLADGVRVQQLLDALVAADRVGERPAP